MKKRAALGIVFLLVCPSVASAQVRSENQSGGVTAETITTLNQNFNRPRLSPYLKNLQTYYAQGGALVREWQSIPETSTDKDIAALGQRSAVWANTTANWIIKNISPAAGERFLLYFPDSTNWRIESANFSATSQRTFEMWYKKLPQFVRNLDALMSSDAMYPQPNMDANPVVNPGVAQKNSE